MLCFAKKTDVANLKSDVYKLDIVKLKNVPTDLNNLKSKKDKLVPVPVDLSKLSDVVKNDVVKKDKYNDKIKNIEDKVADITNLATKTTLSAKINEVKGEIPNITILATISALAAENEIRSTSNLVKMLTVTQKLMNLKKKLPIIVMMNILLLQNLIILQQQFLI